MDNLDKKLKTLILGTVVFSLGVFVGTYGLPGIAQADQEGLFQGNNLRQRSEQSDNGFRSRNRPPNPSNTGEETQEETDSNPDRNTNPQPQAGMEQLLTQVKRAQTQRSHRNAVNQLLDALVERQQNHRQGIQLIRRGLQSILMGTKRIFQEDPVIGSSETGVKSPQPAREPRRERGPYEREQNFRRNPGDTGTRFGN